MHLMNAISVKWCISTAEGKRKIERNEMFELEMLLLPCCRKENPQRAQKI